MPFSSYQLRFYHFFKVHASVHVSWTFLVHKRAAVLCIPKASVEWAWTQWDLRIHWPVHWRTGSRTHDCSLSSRSFLSPGVGSGHICSLEEKSDLGGEKERLKDVKGFEPGLLRKHKELTLKKGSQFHWNMLNLKWWQNIRSIWSGWVTILRTIKARNSV